MIATNERHIGTAEFRQGPQHLPQLRCDSNAGMNQITQHNHPPRPPAMAELEERVEGAVISITGKWNALGLKGLCLAQMQIGQQQLASLRSPKGPLRQEHKLLRAPLPSQLSHQGT